MRRLINAFVVRIWNKYFLMMWLILFYAEWTVQDLSFQKYSVFEHLVTGLFQMKKYGGL